MKLIRLLSLSAIIIAATACSEVKPWQKANLAKDIMEFDANPLEVEFTHHLYDSKEGSSGGYGVGGGGCGCG